MVPVPFLLAAGANLCWGACLVLAALLGLGRLDDQVPDAATGPSVEPSAQPGSA